MYQWNSIRNYSLTFSCWVFYATFHLKNKVENVAREVKFAPSLVSNLYRAINHQTTGLAGPCCGIPGTAYCPSNGGGGGGRGNLLTISVPQVKSQLNYWIVVNDDFDEENLCNQLILIIHINIRWTDKTAIYCTLSSTCKGKKIFMPKCTLDDNNTNTQIDLFYYIS